MAHKSLSPISKIAQARFWQKVSRRAPNECWPWIGALTQKGYGYCFPYGVKGGQYRSHRVAIFLDTGADPGKDGGLHSCDNPPCCNPAHLLAGTQKDNLDGMRARGRDGDHRNFGENHGRCVISDARVAEMLEMRERAPLSWTERALAAYFGISSSQVHRILKRQSRSLPTSEAPVRRRA